MALLGFSGPALAEDVVSEEALHPTTEGTAVVYPVFYAVEFSVKGYSVVAPEKVDGAYAKTPDTPKVSPIPDSREVLNVLPIQVPPQIFLSKLTKSIDEQLDIPKP